MISLTHFLSIFIVYDLVNFHCLWPPAPDYRCVLSLRFSICPVCSAAMLLIYADDKSSLVLTFWRRPVHLYSSRLSNGLADGVTLAPTHTHTHPFNGPFSWTTRVSRYQKGKTNLDFTEARDSEWQWHQLGHMQACNSCETDNHASTPPLSFYRPDALPAAQPTASKHWTQPLAPTLAQIHLVVLNIQ